jgi:HEPN domain-containing protein
MRPKDSHYPADWLSIAEKDLKRVKFLLSAPDAEAAGFYLQQAVEKFLKAFLLSKGWKLQRIHDLEVLLNEAIAYIPALNKFRSICQIIAGFYFVERYPLITSSGITGKDVKDALEQVEELINTLRTETK